jgi:PIN domain nuclease of toxin-antitoxin system
VKLLLDTHVWIWTQEDPDELGANARQMILDGANELLVSCTIAPLSPRTA